MRSVSRQTIRPVLSMIIGVGVLVASANAVAQQAPALAPQSVYCIETTTGTVLRADNIDEVRPPASMLKLMMMLLVSEAVDQKKIDIEYPIRVSETAQGMGGTQVFLKAGEIISLDRMAEALAVASANDAAYAIAETLWGSKEECLKAMNARARQLGMSNTTYHSVNGLPPTPGLPFDQTTARDQMLLALECLKHPRVKKWVSMEEMTFRDGQPAKSNTNKLLFRMPGCDGMKTGYIAAAGFCITATAERDGVRLVCVVMGSPSKYGRFNLAEEIMDEGFRQITRVQVATAGGPVPHPTVIENGDPEEVYFRAKEELSFIAHRDDLPNIRLIYEVDDPMAAPLNEGEVVGTLAAELNGKRLGETAISSPQDIVNTGWRLVVRNGQARWVGLDAPPDAEPVLNGG